MTSNVRRPGWGQLNAERFLLADEEVVFAVRRHVARLTEPIASLVFGCLVVIVIDLLLPQEIPFLAAVFGLILLVLALRLAWKVLQWRYEWFLATNRRLVLTTGVITRKVAMMPLAKVTDMSYAQSPLGRVLGYGSFVMESAGRDDQALNKVQFVPDADANYRALCQVVFTGRA